MLRTLANARWWSDDDQMSADGWFLLGVPWDCSGSGRGEQAAPVALREAGLSALVDRDLGDAVTPITSTSRDPDTGVLALPDTVRAARSVASTLAATLDQLPGRRPLIVGGDCSILLGIVPALRARGLVNLWFVDGHPDYLDGATSPTGETADMDLALLTGSGAAPLVMLTGTSPMIPPERVVLLGHRTDDLDSEATAELARLPAALRRIGAGELTADPAAAAQRAARWLDPQADRSAWGVWLHLDLDVLDPAALPAVTYPQPGGPDWEDLALVLEPLARAPHLIGMSVADFRPDLDPLGEHAADIVALLRRVLPQKFIGQALH
jgi:arginase